MENVLEIYQRGHTVIPHNKNHSHLQPHMCKCNFFKKKDFKKAQEQSCSLFLIEMAKIDSEMSDWDSKSLFVVVAELSHLHIHF